MNMDICGYLGIASGVGKKLVDMIIQYKYELIVAGVAAALLSGGTLASLAAGSEYIIATVLSYYSRSLTAKAIVW